MRQVVLLVVATALYCGGVGLMDAREHTQDRYGRIALGASALLMAIGGHAVQRRAAR